MSAPRLSKFLAISLPAAFFSAMLLALAVEVWVRSTWDSKKGAPGFYLSDPMRRQRLAANYTGWFSGVPVQINSLGFRDPREYDLRKKPTTFRILVLGDSVTFGHGSVFEHTYPHLLETMLKKWRPEIDWQVWNAGVPGYNTTQELAYLLERGAEFQPDLVVVGFYINDIADNYAIEEPTRLGSLESDAISFLQRHWYSLEWYKRIYLTFAWKLSASKSYRLRFEHLSTEEELLAKSGTVADAPEQRLTAFERLTDGQVQSVNCVYGERPNPDSIPEMQRDAGWPAFVDAVRGLQRLQARGAYQLVFFLNIVPPICPDGDVFYDAGSAAENQFFVDLFSRGVPTVSAYDAFRHVRPSQMPQATDHSLGNANELKAETLFHFLRDAVLPARLGRPATARQTSPAPPQGRPR
jgi:GDSL-like Lipase/Acylhydrolase family